MKMLTAVLAALTMMLAVPAIADEAGDAVFTERGPWSLDGGTLDWKLTVTGPKAEGFIAIQDGALSMAQTTDPSDGKPMLQLTEKTDSRTRKIGPFPVSGGDPSLTFFLEQTVRDMAALTGGSPFYIRNRMKDALFRAGQVTHDGGTLTATFQPFKDDPNAPRMHGFETLTLTFVMADPKAPIHEMLAQTAGDQPGYRNRMVLQ